MPFFNPDDIDCAFPRQPGERTLPAGMNVNVYLRNWLVGRGGVDEGKFAVEIADGVDRIISGLNCRVVFVLT